MGCRAIRTAYTHLQLLSTKLTNGVLTFSVALFNAGHSTEEAYNIMLATLPDVGGIMNRRLYMTRTKPNCIGKAVAMALQR